MLKMLKVTLNCIKSYNEICINFKIYFNIYRKNFSTPNKFQVIFKRRQRSLNLYYSVQQGKKAKMRNVISYLLRKCLRRLTTLTIK